MDVRLVDPSLSCEAWRSRTPWREELARLRGRTQGRRRADGWSQVAEKRQPTRTCVRGLGNGVVGTLDDFLARRHCQCLVRQAPRTLRRSATYRPLALRPRSVAVLNNLASTPDGSRKARQGHRCFRKAIELNPNIARHGNLGNAPEGPGKLNEAIACYRKAIELDPKYALAHNNLGIALTVQGKLDEAIACYARPSNSTRNRARPTTTSASP